MRKNVCSRERKVPNLRSLLISVFTKRGIRPKFIQFPRQRRCLSLGRSERITPSPRIPRAPSFRRTSGEQTLDGMLSTTEAGLRRTQGNPHLLRRCHIITARNLGAHARLMVWTLTSMEKIRSLLPVLQIIFLYFLPDSMRSSWLLSETYHDSSMINRLYLISFGGFGTWLPGYVTCSPY